MANKRLTVAEKKALAAEAEAQELNAALAWPVEPEPMPYSKMLIEDYWQKADKSTPIRAWTFNSYSRRVTHGCFTAYSHNTEGDKTTSQTCGGPWFETKAEALLALRWAICRQMAADLRSLAQRATSEPGDE